MDFKEIQELIKLINKSNLTEFKLKDGDFKLSIRTKKFGKVKPQPIVQAPPQMVPIQSSNIPPAQPATPPASAPESSSSNTKKSGESPADEKENYIAVKSPIVGTFYRAPSPDKEPYFKVGDNIQVGDVVCIVEAMKLFNEIESEVSGKIVKVVAEDASPVEYDQVLFLVDPKG